MASAGVSIVEPSGPALQPESQPKHEPAQEEKQDPEPEVRTGSGLATPVASRRRTPESRRDARDVPLETVETLEIPDTPEPFDWDDFERRFEQALRDADENEKQILKEVESLSMVCILSFSGSREPLALTLLLVLPSVGVCGFSQG